MNETPRQRAARAGAALAQLPDEQQAVAAERLGAEDVLARAARVRAHLVEFARENNLIDQLLRRVRTTTQDHRSRLTRLLDGLREALYDSRPFPRAGNPDLSLGEAEELLAGLGALPEIARLRAARFLGGGLPATIALEPGREREVLELFRRFAEETLAPRGDPAARAALEEAARLEADLLEQLQRGRSDGSEAGAALAVAEVEQLLRLVDRLPEPRQRLYLDALAAIGLTPFTYAPGGDTPRATAAAQARLAERFWRDEV